MINAMPFMDPLVRKLESTPWNITFEEATCLQSAFAICPAPAAAHYFMDAMDVAESVVLFNKLHATTGGCETPEEAALAIRRLMRARQHTP